jgi:hypothetical protein
MPKYLTLKDAFIRCKKEGFFIVSEEMSKDQIRSRLIAADSDIQTALDTAKNLSKDSIKWNSVYKLFYDSLHELTEAYLLFNKMKISNHQCLYAYLCEKYPDLDFNWEFFEKVRTKRNGISYYGQLINYSDWKEAELQFKLYTKKLQEEIKKKL